MPTHDHTACTQVYKGEEVIISVESLQGEKLATPIWLFSCFKSGAAGELISEAFG